MILNDIVAKDFLSFGDLSLTFPQSGLVLVTGWDEDLGRANGAGKSSLFQALAWCIYGELPRDIKVDELVRRGQTSCFVTVRCTIDGVQYSITRKRPSGLELIVGGEKVKGNPKYVQALIEQAVGLSYKQFLITSYFPQRGDSSRFLKQNDATAKDFLGTILNFNKTEAAYKKLHNELKEAEMAAAVKRGEVSAAEAAVDRIGSISRMPIPDKPDKEAYLKIKAEMDLLELSTKQPPDTSAIDLEIQKVQAAIQKVQHSKYELSEAKRNIADKTRMIEHVKTHDESYLVCPSCDEHLVSLGGKLEVHDEASAEAAKAEKIQALEASIKTWQDFVTKVEPLVAKESDFTAKLDGLKTKRLQARHDYDMANQRKQHLASQIANFRQATIAWQQAKDQKEKIAQELEAQNVAIVEKQAQLAILEREIMTVAAAKAVMSPTGAIAYSLDAVMSDLNDEVAQYLDIFSHGTMTYRISSGDDKAKVTHHVTKGGVDVSVGSLSGGEERGLILSVDLGLSEVIASRSGVNLPSILMLDECFEGLDYVGKEKVIDALRSIAQNRCIIVVDHSSEFNALFDKNIKVVKKNEVSSLVIE